MTFKYSPVIIAALFVVASHGAASATTVNFDSCTVSGASYSQSGATFTPVGGTALNGAFQSPNGTCALLATDASGTYVPIRADIAGGATSVSVDLGDFDQDADTLFLQIFNSSNVKLNEVDLLVSAAFSGMDTLTLSNANIAYAIFGSTAPSVQGSSVFADNFTFTSNAVTGVPEPLTLSLFGAGLVGAAALRRKAKKKA